MFLYNDPKLKPRRKDLRKAETVDEELLWVKLRRKSLGYKFTRQYSVGPYILDFYCSERRLGIELDGSHHLLNKDYDKERDNYLLYDSTGKRTYFSNFGNPSTSLPCIICLFFPPQK